MRCVPGLWTGERLIRPILMDSVEVSAARLEACMDACACTRPAEGQPEPAELCAVEGKYLATEEELERALETGPRCAVALGAPLAAVPPWPDDPSTFAEKSWYAADPVFREWWGRALSVDDLGASYKSPEQVASLLIALHEAHPERTALHELGRSHQGRPILALRLTDPSIPQRAKPSVLLCGAHHGDELLTVEYAFDAIDKVLENERWLSTLDVWVVPVVNPDGLWISTAIEHGGRGQTGGRKNGRDAPNLCGDRGARLGVDLNRNYPFAWRGPGGSAEPASWNYAGPGPGSEPEVVAIMELAEKRRFVAAVSWHTWGSTVLSPYTIPGKRNPKPDIARQVAEHITTRAFRVRTSLYPVSGTDQDWLYHEHGTLAYIVEGTVHNPAEASLRVEAVQAVWPVTERLLDRVAFGPRVSGFVPEGAAGQVMQVWIEGHLTFEGEHWTSRPDGRFDRLVPDWGTYTVHFEGGSRRTIAVREPAE